MRRVLLIALNAFIFLYSCTQIKDAKEKSSQVSADSLYIVGENYLNEDTDTPKYDSAEYYLSEAANLNYPKAFYTLGNEYALGHKLKSNKEKGVEYLNKAADLGVREAFYSLAHFYYYQSDIENVKKMLEKGSSAGDSYATYQLHMFYYVGYAFGQSEKKDANLIDSQKGLKYLLKAAEMGNFDAQLSLAYLYTKGDEEGFLKPDKEKALYYFEQAQKNPEVQETLGAFDELETTKKDLGFKNR